MKRGITWSYEWFYSLTVVLLFLAVVLRTLLIYRADSAVLGRDLALLLAWLTLLVSQPSLSRRRPRYSLFYLVLQSILLLAMMLSPDSPDYFAILFAVLSMQTMQMFSPRVAAVAIAIFTPLIALALVRLVGPLAAIAFALVYTAANTLFGFFALAARRAGEENCRNQAMLQELQVANRRLQDYARQRERLTAARERNRLARELHDSVTQTVFSMTLTTQSALLLLDREPGRVGAQLDRLSELANSALAEMQTLISELRPETTGGAGLATALRHHLAERRLPENLAVSLEVAGDRPLAPAEEQGLFRIAQEALNNVGKHARASRACVRLDLTEPGWMEIEDDGQGFNLQQVKSQGGIGLASMAERAAEIGWDLRVLTAPGAGTRIRVEKGGSDANR